MPLLSKPFNFNSKYFSQYRIETLWNKTTRKESVVNPVRVYTNVWAPKMIINTGFVTSVQISCISRIIRVWFTSLNAGNRDKIDRRIARSIYYLVVFAIHLYKFNRIPSPPEGNSIFRLYQRWQFKKKLYTPAKIIIRKFRPIVNSPPSDSTSLIPLYFTPFEYTSPRTAKLFWNISGKEKPSGLYSYDAKHLSKSKNCLFATFVPTYVSVSIVTGVHCKI